VERPKSINDPKLKVISAAQALQHALGVFIEALDEYDLVPKGD